MKAIINSLKRTHWFKASVAFLTCLVFLVFPSCQKDEFDQGSIPDMDLMSSSAVSQSSSPIFYYAPEMFQIGSHQVEIKNWFFENFENAFIVKVQNGSSSATKASTVEIKINGKLIITSSDFKKANLVAKKVSGLTWGSTLEVKIEDPGMKSIELWIEGTLINSIQGKIKDVEGNTYKTVKIGDQWWMAENLKTTKYRNGDLIGTTDPETDIIAETEPKYQWAYDGNESNVATYGRLYTWYAITDSKGVCPTGWRVPTYLDWNNLGHYLADGATAGDKLKETGNAHWWYWPNIIATNETGFTALPGGWRYYHGFNDQGNSGYWWSSTEFFPGFAWFTAMGYDRSNNYGGNHFPEMWGFSVRCVKGEPVPLAIGDWYQGGIVAYILQEGDPGYIAGETHGLIAAPSDQGNAEWGCWGTTISGADGTAIGTGNQNTIDIVTGCITAGIAAKLCYDLTLNGYSDWYLPSKFELNLLYLQKNVIGGFHDASYWSSTEIDSYKAWQENFPDSENPWGMDLKSSEYMVRAVRTF